MFFSIIIPIFNQLPLIKGLIDSLSRQSYSRDNFEIILSDDGSTDGSADYISALSYNGLNIKTVLSSEKGCRSKARNNGVKKAIGSHLLFIDGDIVASSNLLEEHAKAHSNLNINKAVFIGKLEPFSPYRKNNFDWYRVSRGAQKVKDIRKVPARYFATNASMPTELFLRTKGFNESYLAWGGEDLEMGYDLEKEEATFYALPTALAYHNDHMEPYDYLARLEAYTKENLTRLIQNNAQHAQIRYVKSLEKQNRPFTLLMKLFSVRVVRSFLILVADKLPVKNIAYLIYDFLTYTTLHANFKKKALSPF